MAELEFEHLMESALKLESPLQTWSINNQPNGKTFTITWLL